MYKTSQKDVLSYEMAHWLRKRGKPMRPKLTKLQREDLKECFNAIDEDGTGGINEDELMEAFKVLGIKASRQEVKKLIEKVDRDNSGAIEFPEFIEIMTVTLSEMTSDNFQKRKRGAAPTSSKGQSYHEMMGMEAETKDGQPANAFTDRVLPFPLIAVALRRKKVVDGLEAFDKEVIRTLNEKREEIEAEEERRRLLHEYMDNKKDQNLRKVVKMKLDRDKRGAFFSQLESSEPYNRRKSAAASLKSGRPSMRELDIETRREIASVMGSDAEDAFDPHDDLDEDEAEEDGWTDEEGDPAPNSQEAGSTTRPSGPEATAAKQSRLAGLSRRIQSTRAMRRSLLLSAQAEAGPLSLGFNQALGYRPGGDKVYKAALHSGPPRSNRNAKLLEAAPPPSIPIFVRRGEAYKPLHNDHIRPHTTQAALRPASANPLSRATSAPAPACHLSLGLGATTKVEAVPPPAHGGIGAWVTPGTTMPRGQGRPSTAQPAAGRVSRPLSQASQKTARMSNNWGFDNNGSLGNARAMTAPAGNMSLKGTTLRPQSAGMFQQFAETSNPKAAQGRNLSRSESNSVRLKMENQAPIRRELDIKRMALDSIYDIPEVSHEFSQWGFSKSNVTGHRGSMKDDDRSSRY